MVQNQWYHIGIGAPPILVHFSGDWDVHWGYGVLTLRPVDNRSATRHKLGDVVLGGSKKLTEDAAAAALAGELAPTVQSLERQLVLESNDAMDQSFFEEPPFFVGFTGKPTWKPPFWWSPCFYLMQAHM